MSRIENEIKESYDTLNEINKTDSPNVFERVSNKLNTLEVKRDDLKLKLNEIDLVLMDIQMPVMDGHQASIIIRQKLNIDVPVIGVSANVFKEDIDKSLFVGMNAHIGKPFTSKELFEVISKFVFENPEGNRLLLSAK